MQYDFNLLLVLYNHIKKPAGNPKDIWSSYKKNLL